MLHYNYNNEPHNGVGNYGATKTYYDVGPFANSTIFGFETRTYN